MKVWQKYLDKLNDDQKDLVVNTLQIAKKHVPEASEAMPYGVPGLKYKEKPLIAVAAHKEHLGIYPFSPKIVKKIKPMLTNGIASNGTVSFTYGNTPSKEVIIEMINLRMQEIN